MSRHFFHSVLCLLSLLLFASCQKRVLIAELLFNESLTNAYFDGQPFTGTAWSDDGQSIRLVCDQGAVNLIEVYHSNGTVAMQNTSITGTATCYDYHGKTIPIEAFVQYYPEVIEQVNHMVDFMYFSNELK